MQLPAPLAGQVVKKGSFIRLQVCPALIPGQAASPDTVAGQKGIPIAIETKPKKACDELL